MKKKMRFLFAITMLISFASCLSAQGAQQAARPDWVSNLERAYPSRDWIAVIGEGTSRAQAENAAMSVLARTFRTDTESLTQSAQRYSQLINGATGNTVFDESKNFAQQVNVNSNIRGLIGVQVDVYNNANSITHYALARMNRRECSARYSAMIRENTAVINSLISSVSGQANLDTYSKLSFAHSIARETDNFQNILEVLDSTAVNRKPNYGTANAIKLRMIEAAGRITIGIHLTAEDRTIGVLFIRAVGSFFKDLGFKVNEGTAAAGNENYLLSVNVRFEDIIQNVVSCRYYIDASLADRNGVSIFTFTEDDRRAHPNNINEARRLVVRAAEESFKEGRFAEEFNSWLMKNE